MKKLLGLIVLLASATMLLAQHPVGEMTMDPEKGKEIFKKKGYSPYAGRNFPSMVYWGDTHLHTSNSLDARAFGTIMGPEEAYRLARGEEIMATHGQAVKLSRPLDWLVVADHSDGLGTMNEIIDGNPDLLRDPVVKDWHDRIIQGGETAMLATMDIINSITTGDVPQVMLDKTFAQSIWDEYIDIAEEYNDPGRFTALIGYEWTSTPDGNNLHRNVVYRDGGDKARRVLPYTTIDSSNPEDLWNWMTSYEEHTGGRVLAIAHNGNLSNGIMFPVETNPATGEALTGDYAATRAKWEPLYEATQIKGDGETHPLLSPNDELADYETWQKGNLNLSVPKTDEMLQYEYAREALKNGLKLESTLGTNPYKFGMIGSTDSHTGLATAAEENFFGKHSGNEPSAHRAEGIMAKFGDATVMDWELVASGYAGVWATENTRKGIFDAMMRKEVYATTGPRMIVRFFGGWDFTPEDAYQRLPAAVGYHKGVPMGGDLHQAEDGQAPTFLVAALKDPLSGNLDRIQIIKGWLDVSGETHEQVYNVAWGDADTRQMDNNGNIPVVGNTVDVENVTWTNTIGDSELITVWKDPDFDPSLKAFYYARVVEIPTPRWTAYDAQRFDVKMPEESPMTTTERAYTSPIWYTPN